MGSTNLYAQKHNPFVYFDPIRLNPERCTRSVVPLTQLQTDIAANALPNFMFIKPNICNNSHDCPLDISDAWLTNLLDTAHPRPGCDGSDLLRCHVIRRRAGIAYLLRLAGTRRRACACGYLFAAGQKWV